MLNIFDLLNTLGIHIDNSAPDIVLLGLSFFILSSIGVCTVINILIYLLSIYIVSHEKFLNKIPSKYVYVHKFINFYKNVRISFIILESIILLTCLFSMVYLSYQIVGLYIV